MSETTIDKAVEVLSARGITTLEQFVESKAAMRRPRRIDAEEELQAIVERSARADTSFRSEIGPPAPSVALVLDGKRVEYDAIERLDGQPLDYVATRLKDGTRALVAFSDRTIIREHRLRQFRGPVKAINADVEKALVASGLQPSAPATRGIELGGRIFTHHFFQGDSATFGPDEYVPDMTEFDEGLGVFGGDWNDKVSSIQMGRCWCQAWEGVNESGSSLSFHQDIGELDSLGWNDRISGIWFPFRGY